MHPKWLNLKVVPQKGSMDRLDVVIGWIGHVSLDQMTTCIPHHFLSSNPTILHKIHAIYYGQIYLFSLLSIFVPSMHASIGEHSRTIK